MVVYLPIAFIKDWFCSLFHIYLLNDIGNGSSVACSSTGLDVPLTINDMYQVPETEASCCLVTDKDLREREEGWPVLVRKGEEEPPSPGQNCKLNSLEVAKCSLCLAPIWFVTEVIWFIHYLSFGRHWSCKGAWWGNQCLLLIVTRKKKKSHCHLKPMELIFPTKCICYFFLLFMGLKI